MEDGPSYLIPKEYNQEPNNLAHTNNNGIEKLAFNLENMRFEITIDKQHEDEEDPNLQLRLSSYDSLPIARANQENFKSLITCPRYYYTSIASLNDRFHNLIRSGEIYKQRSERRITEYWVHFSCQMLKWEAFDPITKNWIDMPTISADKCFELSDKESIGVGTQLLVLGKDILGQAIYKYSLLTNSWSEVEPMKTPRCLFGSGNLGKTAIFAGGVNLHGKVMDIVESYDTEMGVWEMLPCLLKPRKMSSGVVMDGKFYVIGGSDGKNIKELLCGEEYDPVAKKWRHIPNMSPGGGGGLMAPPLLAVVDNQLYAADYSTMVVKKYDKENNVWKSIGVFPERTDNENGWGIAFKGCGDRVIIVGGVRKQGGSHLAIYSWVPSEGPPKWTMIGHKRSNNFVYNCAVMGC